MRKYLNARFGPGQACVNRQGQVLIRRNNRQSDQASWYAIGESRDFMREVEVSRTQSTRRPPATRFKTRANQTSKSKIGHRPQVSDVPATDHPLPKAKPELDDKAKKAQLAAELGLKALREYQAREKAVLGRMAQLKALRLARKAQNSEA